MLQALRPAARREGTRRGLTEKNKTRVWNDNYSNWYVWKHLCCWRVPQAVYDALPEDLSDKAAVLFAVKGMKDRILSIDDTLTDDDYAAVADWVADKANYSNHDSDGNNWKLKPKKAAKKKKALAADEAEAAEKAVLTEVPVAAAAQRPKKKAKKESAPTSNVGRPAKNENARPYTTDNLPVAGQDGAAAPDCLAGLKVVVTGFSKKDKGAAEDLVLAFGGKKMSSVSKNTGLVLCGLTPGQGKLDKAESLGVRKCDFCDFCDMLRDGTIAQLLG